MSPPLPDFELEVAPPLAITLVRTPEEYVRSLLQLDVKDPRYAKSKMGTRCNWLVHDGALCLGVPMPRVHGWPMLANDMQGYWADPANGWQAMVWQDAVMSANLGYPTVTSRKEEGHGHTSWVLPCNPQEIRDVMTMQAGGSNFYGRQIVYGYGTDLSKVLFFGHA